MKEDHVGAVGVHGAPCLVRYVELDELAAMVEQQGLRAVECFGCADGVGRFWAARVRSAGRGSLLTEGCGTILEGIDTGEFQGGVGRGAASSWCLLVELASSLRMRRDPFGLSFRLGGHN